MLLGNTQARTHFQRKAEFQNREVTITFNCSETSLFDPYLLINNLLYPEGILQELKYKLEAVVGMASFLQH